ncbi:cytochrome P450 [Nocardioides dilutus]
MTTAVSHPPVAYAPGGGEAWRKPWAGLAALRDHDPVHHVVPEHRPDADFYVLTRHADVLAAAVDGATFSSAQGLTVEYGELEKIGLVDNPPLVMLDPPEHTAFRRLVSRGFTPRQVQDVEPAVRAYVAERVQRIVDRGHGDIVVELFKPLPSMVVAHYLGVPAENRDRFDAWTDAIVAASSTGDPTDAADATAELLGYFSSLIERRRTAPGDDTISHLVAAGVGDAGPDHGAGLVSILGYVFAMVTGGNDTTTGALGGAVQLLAEHPTQRAVLVADPLLTKAAVEEFLRLTSPVQALARTTTRDVELHGIRIPAGRKVLLHYGAANRDPRRYGPDADELDVHRAPSQILAFGQGGHHCLGNAAARMQVRVALEELLARIPHFSVDAEAVRWAPGPYVRRPVTMPFVVTEPR